MGFINGNGSQANPYLIEDADTAKFFLQSCLATTSYYALVKDIDISSVVVSIPWVRWGFNLDGRGNTLKTRVNSTDSNSFMKGAKNCKVGKICWHFLTDNKYITSGSRPLYEDETIIASNCKFVFYKTFVSSCDIMSGNDNLIVNSNIGFFKSTGRNFYQGGINPANLVNINTFANGNIADPANYPTFDAQYWIFDGVSAPTPRPQSTADITRRRAVSGSTKVGGLAKVRNIAIFTPSNGFVIKRGESNSSGQFIIDMWDVSVPVIVTIYDMIGLPFVPGAAYKLGDRIHPDIANGYYYECTTAGTSGTSYPTAWPTTGTLNSGSAIFTAKPIFEPDSFLVKPQLINILTGLPVA